MSVVVTDAGFDPVVVGPLRTADSFAMGSPGFGLELTAPDLRTRLGSDPALAAVTGVAGAVSAGWSAVTGAITAAMAAVMSIIAAGWPPRRPRRCARATWI